MSQIRKSLAGEEDLAFDLNRNNETYDILDSNGQLSIRHKINAKSIPVTADIAYGTNENVYDYLKDLVALLNAFDLFQDTNATQLNFNKSKVDYVTINSSLALLTKPPVGEVAVFVVGGSVQVNPEDFTVEGSIVTFVEGLFLDGTKVVCLYSINDYTYPALPGGDTDERIEQLEAEQAIQAVAIDARSKWVYPPKSQGQPWQQNEWTRDSDWTMIANKDTFDRPAPQANGDVISSTPIEPVLTTDNNTGFVQSGQVYEFTEAGVLNKVEVYVPATGPDITYRVILADVTDPENPIVSIIDNPILVANEWNIIALGSFLVSTGSIFQVRIDTLNSGSNTTVTGGWKYAGTNNNGTPTTSEWNRNNRQDELRINKTDLDLINRSAELNGIIAGSTVLMSQTSTPSRYNEYIVNSIIDGTDYVEYGVTLVESGGGGPEVDQPTTMTATIPIPSVTEYSEEINYYASNSPSFANVIGTLILSGTPQGGIANNLFGVQIEFQPYTFSPDWDTVAVANVAGGGSGGGGGSDSLPLTGGTMSGNIDMALYNLDRVGLMVMGENQDVSRSIDLRCSIDPLQSQYSTRLIRNGGSNADFVIRHAGAGRIALDTEGGDVLVNYGLDVGGNTEIGGTLSVDDTLFMNGNVISDILEVNLGNNGESRNHAIDFICSDDPTHSTYSLRLDRSAGLNGASRLTNRGTGGISLDADAGAVKVKSNFIAEAGTDLRGGDTNLNMNNLVRVASVRLGQETSEQSSIIEFHSTADPSQADYSAFMRRNTGVDGPFELKNKGGGTFIIENEGLGTLLLKSDALISLEPTGSVFLKPETGFVTLDSVARIVNSLDPVIDQDLVTKIYSDKGTGTKRYARIANGTTTPTFVTSRGISGITREAQGKYTITLSSPVADRSKMMINFLYLGSGSTMRTVVLDTNPSSSSILKINTVDESSTFRDSTDFQISIQEF